MKVQVMTVLRDCPILGIGIDHGFSAIKLSDDDFPTAITQVDEPITTENILEIGGVNYRIGGRRIDVREDKTSDDSFNPLDRASFPQTLPRSSGAPWKG